MAVATCSAIVRCHQRRGFSQHRYRLTTPGQLDFLTRLGLVHDVRQIRAGFGDGVALGHGGECTFGCTLVQARPPTNRTACARRWRISAAPRPVPGTETLWPARFVPKFTGSWGRTCRRRLALSHCVEPPLTLGAGYRASGASRWRVRSAPPRSGSGRALAERSRHWDGFPVSCRGCGSPRPGRRFRPVPPRARS